ncbi:hypothetical protein GDO86_019850 [Hymenochirus boettgeri]|uniref:GPI ethanolamine phosphate transferase 3 n=1 Tax=Hymenochirus boettgeri TaxID=247094 RepID=A0A8T2IGT6_9PIPI|nr:hypothetical protein GDO86_019850 [Hymenochirus boettgeri]
MGADWDIIIAHFLGVDHCGHKHGPGHPETANKLTQMNTVISSPVERLDDKHCLNLVPTLSLLLGVPIPYSNLGAVISDFYSFPERRLVDRFLHSYSLAAGDLPADQLENLKDLFSSLKAEYQLLISEGNQSSEFENLLQKHVQGVQNYLVQARALCTESWARFHPLRMIVGCSILCASCLLCYLVAEAGILLDISYRSLITYTLLWSLGAGTLLAFGIWTSWMEWDPLSLWALVIAASQIMFFCKVRKVNNLCRRFRPRRVSLILSSSCLILFFRCCALFSDSFVVAEGRIAPFFLTSLLMLTVARLHWDGRLTLPTFTPLGDTLKPLLSPSYRKDGPWLVILLAALMLCARLSRFFHNCREESPDCQPSCFLAPLSSIKDPQLKNVSYLGCIMCLVAIVYSVRRWLQHYGNLNSSSPLVLYVRWGFPLIALVITSYWAVSAGTENSLARLRDLTRLSLVACPRAVYALAGLGLMLLLWDPVTVFMKRSRDSDSDNTVTTYRGAPASEAELLHVIPQIYRKMRRSMKSRLRPGNEDEKKGTTVEAYGLGSVYSAAVIITLTLLSLVLLLLHSERITPAFLILLLEAFVILQIHSHVHNLYCPPDSSEQFSVPWYAVLSWGLAGTQWFYSTGHQPVFPAIHWNAAFVGFQEGHGSNFTPALLVAANTFSAHILFSAGSSLLIFWPFLCEAPDSKKKKGKKDSDEGEKDREDSPLMEMRLRENPDKFYAALLQLSAKFLFIHGVQLLSCVCAAMILRRHLMRVSVPGDCFVLWVDYAVTSWFKTLILQQPRP